MFRNRKTLGFFVIVIAIGCVLPLLGATAKGRTILFIGNSFTFAANSPAVHYRMNSVTDLNGPNAQGQTVGGVPAIFKAFTEEVGLDYEVSLETVGGKGLDYHYQSKLPLLDRAWDDVVLQSYSTLDEAHPGDPELLVHYTKLFYEKLHARNPEVKVWLDATWSRPDLTYPAGKPWSGKTIQQMALDVQVGYEQALKAVPGILGIIPVGLAFNKAIATGLADPNPYDGIAANQIDLWSYDHYHASAFGYYLEALLEFGKVTGRDPLSLEGKDLVAGDFGFSAAQGKALRQIAHDMLGE